MERLPLAKIPDRNGATERRFPVVVTSLGVLSF
jgi:hypothetical protein